MAQTEAEKMAARIRHGARSVRPSAAGTNDWLDDIQDTLVRNTKSLGEQIEAHPESERDFLPILTQLVDLSMRIVTMRHDVASGQPPRVPVDRPGAGGEDGGMEPRVAKLEATVEHIQQNIKELKDDVRVLRADVIGIRTTDFRLTFGAIIAVALGLAGLMAKGFHWF